MALDPVPVVGDLGVHTGIIGISAALSPRHDTSEASIDGHGTAGVTLAGIPATLPQIASADLAAGKASLPVVTVGFATEIGAHQGHGHAPELVRIVIDAGVSPAGDDRPGAGVGLISPL